LMIARIGAPMIAGKGAQFSLFELNAIMGIRFGRLVTALNSAGSIDHEPHSADRP
jgi:hypothetical protein